MSLRTPLAIVAAVGRNGAIGAGGRLPWTMPGDLSRFRDLTMGKPMIMGWRTLASIGRALPGRESIVVSRDVGRMVPAGVRLVPTLDAAVELAQARAEAMAAAEVSVIGGSRVFAELMDRTSRLYLTYVDLAPEADTFFPSVDPAVWRETSRHVPVRHPQDEAACVFVNHVRRRSVC